LAILVRASCRAATSIRRDGDVLSRLERWLEVAWFTLWQARWATALTLLGLVAVRVSGRPLLVPVPDDRCGRCFVRAVSSCRPSWPRPRFEARWARSGRSPACTAARALTASSFAS